MCCHSIRNIRDSICFVERPWFIPPVRTTRFVDIRPTIRIMPVQVEEETTYRWHASTLQYRAPSVVIPPTSPDISILGRDGPEWY